MIIISHYADNSDKMGGGHLPQVPDHRIYDNWREFPELAQHERRLQSLGLKDPWIRCVFTSPSPATLF